MVAKEVRVEVEATLSDRAASGLAEQESGDLSAAQ